MINKNKPWTKEEENLLIKLRESGDTYKEISIEIGRSVESCVKKYKRLTDPKYIEKDKQYREDNKDRIAEYQKQYRKDNKDEIAEYNKQYREDNKEKIAEQQKQYRKDNKEKKKEYDKQYYQNNKEKKKQYQKQYRENNKDKIAEYTRNYYAQNPDKSIREERYAGEFEDRRLCYEFYNGISPITGTKDDLQVHHLISVKNNKEFWQSATDEEKIDNLILIPKDIHMAYHSWMGGTKIHSTSESFWEFIDNIYFNKQTTLDSFG